MSHRKLSLIMLTGLLLYAALFQDMRGLWETSEGRYVNVAVQMLRFDDWLQPMTHHEHPHWTKPPFTYWAIAASVETFGSQSEWVLRVPGMLAFVLTTVMVYLLGRVFVPQRPWLPALIYASCLLPATASNVITTDNLLTFVVTASMTGFVYAFWAPDGSFSARYGALFGWLAAGLGYLVKGPAVALPLFAFLLFYFMYRQRFERVRLYWLSGIPLAAILGGSWYLMLADSYPWLFVDFIHNEVLLRATAGLHHRNDEWWGGFYVYLPTLILGSLPWTLHVWHGVKQALLNWYRALRGSPTAVDDKDRLLLLWLLLPLLVFMLARSRLALYVLPLFVPLSLLAARRMESLFTRRHWYLIPLSGVLVVLGLRLGAGFIYDDRDSRRLAAELQVLWPHRVKEVVFVDDSSHQGLAYYLDTEVEELALSHAEHNDADPTQTVAEELQEAEGEEERLWLVLKNEFSRFEAITTQAGYIPEFLGSVRGLADYGVYRVNSP